MRTAIIIFVFAIVFAGCKKKTAVEEQPVSSSPAKTTTYTIKDYMPLKYGNYWVYQRTVTDTNNVVTSTYIDSCYVNDSLFTHGKWFYRLTAIGPIDNYYTDSANCIINGNGSIFIDLVNNDTVSIESHSYPGEWSTLYNIMNTNPSSFTYNSSTYTNCISRYGYFYSNMNPYCPNWILKNTYAPGVGVVYSKFGFINSCDVWEINLLRYKIN